jgi:hypothetical protein
MADGQGTGPVNVYEVLRERINEVRDDVKELRTAIGQRTKQGECNRIHDELGKKLEKFGKRMDEFRQELGAVESDLAERVEVVEGSVEEAKAMTRDVVQEAVATELVRANGDMKDAVVAELRKANRGSFWPRTFSEWVKTVAVVLALLGLGWTWIEGYGDARIAEQKREETLKRMEQVVNRMRATPAVPLKP